MTKLSGVGFVRLDSGRELNLSGSESDMYTVHARSTQYMLGVRFVRACHLALPRAFSLHESEGRSIS